MIPTTTLNGSPIVRPARKPIVLTVDGYLTLDAWDIAIIADGFIHTTSGSVYEVETHKLTMMLMQMRTIGDAPTLMAVFDVAEQRQVMIVIENIAAIVRHEDEAYAGIHMRIAERGQVTTLAVSLSDAEAVTRRWCSIGNHPEPWCC